MDEQQDTVESNSSQQNGTGAQDITIDEQKWTDRGNAAAQDGDYEGAAEAFQHAVDANPNDARARYNLALAKQLLDDAEVAIAGYRRAIDLDPQLIEAYMNLGNLSSELGLHEEAIETYQQALILNPDNDSAAANLRDARELVNEQIRRIAVQEKQVDEDPS